MTFAVRRLAIALTLCACGPTSTGNPDAAAGECAALDCASLSDCSELSEAVCEGVCTCFPDRWRTEAWSHYSACAASCSASNDTHVMCLIAASGQQPAFSDPSYAANCDAKRSVCPTYPASACDPVLLRVQAASTIDLLEACLGEPCDGSGATCVDEALSCGRGLYSSP